eukprot:3418125-Pleurochrysis_carterae.AAC.1
MAAGGAHARTVSDASTCDRRVAAERSAVDACLVEGHLLHLDGEALVPACAQHGGQIQRNLRSMRIGTGGRCLLSNRGLGLQGRGAPKHANDGPQKSSFYSGRRQSEAHFSPDYRSGFDPYR